MLLVNNHIHVHLQSNTEGGGKVKTKQSITEDTFLHL